MKIEIGSKWTPREPLSAAWVGTYKTVTRVVSKGMVWFCEENDSSEFGMTQEVFEKLYIPLLEYK